MTTRHYLLGRQQSCAIRARLAMQRARATRGLLIDQRAYVASLERRGDAQSWHLESARHHAAHFERQLAAQVQTARREIRNWRHFRARREATPTAYPPEA